jgi:transposase
MKIGMAVERNGIPVGVLTDAADVGEPDLGERVLTRLPPEAGVGVPDDVPVVADRGFDSDALRDDLADLGFRLLAPHRRNRKRPSRNDGRRMRRYRRRYIVERTFGWLHSYRRLLVRHEFYAHLYDGFLHLACAIIAVGKI